MRGWNPDAGPRLRGADDFLGGCPMRVLRYERILAGTALALILATPAITHAQIETPAPEAGMPAPETVPPMPTDETSTREVPTIATRPAPAPMAIPSPAPMPMPAPAAAPA